LWLLAFVGLVPLLIYLDHSPNLRRTIRGGVIFAVVLYGFTLNWLAGMVQFSWLCVPAYVFVVLLYACGFFVFVIPVVTLKSYLSLPFWCAAPFAWVARERLRGYGDLAFPWSNLGCTLTSFPFLVQFADIAGVFGVSFWLVLINCLLFEIISAHKNRRRAYPYVIACFAVILFALGYDGMRWIKGPASAATYKELAFVQPNIPQKLKWDDR
jgi:apolipoprotein N-acyltransferase